MTKNQFTLAVIGASGASGLEVCQRAQELGFRVLPIVRSPERYPQKNPNLRRADVLDENSLIEALEGVDVVVGCFGVPGSLKHAFSATTLYSRGIRNVISAMQKNGIKRLVMLSSAAVLHCPSNGFFWNFVLRPFCWRMYSDVSEMELLIAQSGLDWTLVRPPQLIDASSSVYEARPDAPPDGPTQLGRRALSVFVIDEAIGADAIGKKLTVLRSFNGPAPQRTRST